MFCRCFHFIALKTLRDFLNYFLPYLFPQRVLQTNSINIILKVLLQLTFSLLPFDFLVWLSEDANQTNIFSHPRTEI